MKHCSRAAAFLLLCCAAWAAQAAPISERVVAVRPDGSVQLEKSGKAVFANIRIVDKKLAESWLAEHLLQQMITFETGETDRYGRTIITSNAAQTMLRDGAAMLYATEGNIPADWHTAETVARSKKIGLWKNKTVLISAQNAAQHSGSFHVIEGTITRIYTGKSATYLNFGEDWHTDFSVTIPAKLRRSMNAELASMKPGTNIRIKGTIFDENGPMILLSHPDNLERY